MGVCRICQGGPNFWDSERVASGEAYCGGWRSYARAKGGGGWVRVHAPPRNGTIWCIMEHIFIKFLLKKGAIYNVKYSLLHKKGRYIEATRLLWGFESMLSGPFFVRTVQFGEF